MTFGGEGLDALGDALVCSRTSQLGWLACDGFVIDEATQHVQVTSDDL